MGEQDCMTPTRPFTVVPAMTETEATRIPWKDKAHANMHRNTDSVP